MKTPGLPNHLKTYLTFSKSERNGIIVLIVILVVIIIATSLIRNSEGPVNDRDFMALQKQVDSLFIDKEEKITWNKATFAERRKKVKEILPQTSIELNGTDSLELTNLPGIGPVMASRIMKYRTLLGGYYQKGQLKEVYGFKDEYFQKAARYIYIDTSKIIKFELDTAGYKTLYRHPYIGKEKARKILGLKKQKGGAPILLQDLNHLQVFDTIDWERVKPYLVFRKKTSAE